jgi:DNA-binding response OmpR family regulator
VPAELLDLGADDFFRKGGPLGELLARMRAVARRRSTPGVASQALEVDVRRHEIRWQGQALPVTTIEYRLLAALVERAGEVVEREDLLTAGWPDTPDPDPLWLKSHVARLRDKLAQSGAPVPVAVRGVGYRLDLP